MWCRKCQGLAFAGDPKGLGPCPAGGSHNHSGSGDYTLMDQPFGYENHLNTAFGGHEMGHCLGLDHAHCAGVVDPAPNWDYCDTWDIMGANGIAFYNSASKFSW